MKKCQEEKKKDNIHKVCYFVFANSISPCNSRQHSTSKPEYSQLKTIRIKK